MASLPATDLLLTFANYLPEFTMKNYILITLASLILAHPAQSQGRAGDLDPSFHYGVGPTHNFDVWESGLDGSVAAAAVFPSGKSLLVGAFTSFNNTPQPHITRLQLDGTPDPTFSVGSGFDRAPSHIVAEPEGTFLVSGSFTTYQGAQVPGLVRIDSNGRALLSYAIGLGPNGSINKVYPLPHGRALIIGSFTRVAGQARAGVAVLSREGRLSNCLPGTLEAMGGAIEVAAFRPPNSLYLAGSFTSFRTSNGIVYNHKAITHVDTNGLMIPNFRSTVTNGSISHLLVPPRGGNLIVSGFFQAEIPYRGERVASMHPSGLFNSLSSHRDLTLSSCYSIAPYDSTRFWAIGAQSSINNNEPTRLHRVYYSMRADRTYTPSPTISDITMVASFPHRIGPNRILLTNRMLRLFGVGGRVLTLLDSNMNRLPSFSNGTLGTLEPIQDLKRTASGQYLIADVFTNYNYRPRNGIARLDSSGALDGIFANPSIRFSANTYPGFTKVLALPHGRQLLYGQQFEVPGHNRFVTCIAVNLVGLVDLTFQPQYLNLIDWVALPDGRYYTLENGYIPSIGSITQVKRYLPNGQPDNTYLQPYTRGRLSSLALRPDSKLWVGGTFSSLGGTQAKNLALIDTAGNLDPSYNSAFSPDSTVQRIALNTADGSFYINGPFASLSNGLVSSPYLARYNSQGIPNHRFVSGMSSQNLSAMAVQRDGKLVVAGLSATYGTQNVPNLIRLDTLGNVDPTFYSGTGVRGGNISKLLIEEPSGKIVVAGSFTSYQNYSTPGIFRIHGDCSSGTCPTVGLPDDGVQKASRVPWLYPNPSFHSQFQLSDIETESTNVSLYSAQGVLIGQQPLKEDQVYTWPSLAPGLYLVKAGRHTLRWIIK